MTKINLFFFASLLCMNMLCSSSAFASASKDLQQLFDDAWQQQLHDSPIFASSQGLTEYADKMPDLSATAANTRHQQNTRLLKRAQAINVANLTDSERVSHELFEYQLKQAINAHELDEAVYAQGTQSGFLHTLLYLPRYSTPLKTREDADHYLKRLAAIPEYLRQNRVLLQRGIDTQRVQSRISMAPIIALAKQFNPENVRDNPLYSPLIAMPDSISSSEQNALQQAADKLFAKSVQPAIADMVAYLEGPYTQAASLNVGLSYQNDGKRYYEFLIKRHTTTDQTAQAIHDIGLAEVARIRGEMKAIMQEVGFKGSLEGFIRSLRENPEFYATSEQDLLERAAWIAKTLDGKLPAFFGRLPRKPYTVEPVPTALAPDYTAARYLGGNNSREPGTYWVNTWDLPSRPLFGLPALTAHEAVPGHHLQIALAQELEDLPTFRKHSGFTAYVEGWALYSEYLGIAMAIYTTPYEHFGRLSFEMWRACRLVVDTGIHALGWSRKQAIEFMTANTALSKKDVEVEVDRYISWPGQALGYKMGELKIKALRQQAETALGEQFDLRDFHDVILGAGPLPLALLERRINRWIAQQKNT